MKIMTIEELPGRVPPKHYDLLGRTIADESNGVKQFRVAFTRMEKTGRCDPHIHENAEQLFILLKGAMMFQFDKRVPIKKDRRPSHREDAFQSYCGRW
jgi:quercetin dioxygenase-like cupin family protein